MLTYHMDGCLYKGILIADFTPVETREEKVVMYVEKGKVPKQSFFGIGDVVEGWREIFVRELNEKIVKEVLAHSNKISTTEIRIVEAHQRLTPATFPK
ncbi:MAG: hypothetical protein HZA36_00300 [Parcubacteria group bacterium]|nr:hypothetical protein [Parcubacteria group bacterium]